MRVLSKDNDVYVSEYKSPDDFECVLEIPTKLLLEMAMIKFHIELKSFLNIDNER